MGFLDRIIGNNSAQSAKERLQLVLIHDRTDLTSSALAALKDDLISTISQHIDIDPGNIRIEVEHEGRSQRLIADIPLRSASKKRSG